MTVGKSQASARSARAIPKCGNKRTVEVDVLFRGRHARRRESVGMLQATRVILNSHQPPDEQFVRCSGPRQATVSALCLECAPCGCISPAKCCSLGSRQLEQSSWRWATAQSSARPASRAVWHRDLRRVRANGVRAVAESGSGFRWSELTLGNDECVAFREGPNVEE